MIAIFAAALLTIQSSGAATDSSVLDGRGWTLRCAASAGLAKELSETRVFIARSDGAEDEVVEHQAAVARWDRIYRDSLAAPADVTAGPERFALAHQFREWANGLEKTDLEDVLAACEVALAGSGSAP